MTYVNKILYIDAEELLKKRHRTSIIISNTYPLSTYLVFLTNSLEHLATTYFRRKKRAQDGETQDYCRDGETRIIINIERNRTSVRIHDLGSIQGVLKLSSKIKSSKIYKKLGYFWDMYREVSEYYRYPIQVQRRYVSYF